MDDEGPSCSTNGCVSTWKEAEAERKSTDSHPTIRPEIVYVQSQAKKCRVVLTSSSLKYPKDLNHQSDTGSWARKGLTLA